LPGKQFSLRVPLVVDRHLLLVVDPYGGAEVKVPAGNEQFFPLDRSARDRWLCRQGAIRQRQFPDPPSERGGPQDLPGGAVSENLEVLDDGIRQPVAELQPTLPLVGAAINPGYRTTIKDIRIL